MVGVAVVVLVYLALNAAYVAVLPLDRVLASTRIAADAASAVAGPRAATAISMLVAVSALGAMTGIILAGPRVYYAMAQDGLLFEWMGRVHPRFNTPHLAIVAQAIWASVLVATGTYRALFTRVVYTEWIFFGALAVGVMRLRASRAYAPAFRAWGFPVTPLLFTAVCALIVVSQVVADPRESATGLALVAAGLPVYLVWANLATFRGRTGVRPQFKV
jgi:APA family basic amino acid/polyamine antiporter